jgi:hypothetical protein
VRNVNYQSDGDKRKWYPVATLLGEPAGKVSWDTWAIA